MTYVVGGECRSPRIVPRREWVITSSICTRRWRAPSCLSNSLDDGQYNSLKSSAGSTVAAPHHPRVTCAGATERSNWKHFLAAPVFYKVPTCCQSYSVSCKFLWPPYGIGQAIIFLPCGFFFLSFFLLYGRPVRSRCGHYMFVLFMVALWNRADHYIFIPSFVLFLLSIFLFFLA